MCARACGVRYQSAGDVSAKAKEDAQHALDRGGLAWVVKEFVAARGVCDQHHVRPPVRPSARAVRASVRGNECAAKGPMRPIDIRY